MNRLAELVGPVFNTVGVHRLLGIDSLDAEARHQIGELLALRTADDQVVYPTFQFSGSSINPDMAALFIRFAKVPNTPWWTVAAWFQTPRPELDGSTPADWVRDGRGLEALEPSIMECVHRWSQ